MKTVLLGTIPILIALSACSVFQKTEPEPEEIQTPATVGYITLPSEELAKKSGTSLKELHIGFGVYVRNCGECHTHALPDDVSKEDWHVITPKMSWNSNITDAEQAALLKYILAAKSDPLQPSEQPEIKFTPAKPKS